MFLPGCGKLGNLAGGQQEGADAIELSVVLVDLVRARSDPLYSAQLAVRLHRGPQSTPAAIDRGPVVRGP